MDNDTAISLALEQAWHAETARNSLERWVKLGEQEHWSGKPENLSLLIRIFGASWYFTRIVFVNGAVAANLIDETGAMKFDRNSLAETLKPSLELSETEEQLNRLRVLKNISMLRILLSFFRDEIGLEGMEHALTELADVTLEVLVRILEMQPRQTGFPITVLGMGRLAGYEMTFGSDLDLIFLYDPDDPELHENPGKSIRLLLRTIAQPSSSGSLYDVDMRLRPHGNSGPLITPYNSFIEYHGGEREIWERQMMTRCRAVLTLSRNVEPVLSAVNGSIYKEYDPNVLRQEVVTMRTRVQKELGSPKGRYEIKRGYGGIMDIDFITHYFQLGFGYKHHELQTASTRTALKEMGNLGLVQKNVTSALLDSYNYLKRVEMCLRLFDLKSVDSFTVSEEENLPLSRAMGHGDDTRSFINEYESITRQVRHTFQDLIGTVG